MAGRVRYPAADMRRLVTIAASGILGLILSANAQVRPPQRRAPLPEGVTVQRDLEYVPGGGKSRSLDIYLPAKADAPRPLIVWIHGGAWRAGSKDNCPAIPLTGRGYVVASINYRLSQEAVFPGQIYDCKAAIRWLRANADKYGIDPKRIGVWGSSAGGHLVALLGTAGDVKVLEGDAGNNNQSSRVQAVCDWFGPSDLARMGEGKSHMDHLAPDSPESRLIGGAVLENKDKAAAASPVTYVSKDDPPFLIMHGDQDFTVPILQSQILAETLTKAGVDVTFRTIAGAGHGFGGRDIFEEVGAFFDKHLQPPRTP